MRRRLLLGALTALFPLAIASSATAQDQPPPPQNQPPPPPQGYPQQPPQYPPQGQPPQYPPQGQPPQYPPQGQPPQYPPQGQPPQYPPQGQPQGYPPPQGQGFPPPQGPYQPQQPPPPPAPAANDGLRSQGEMVFMYGTGVGYGVGTGIWIDLLAKTTDPGIAIIAPITLGALVPVGMAIWDYAGRIHRAVPASVGTGLMLGAMEGLAISGTQWQLTGPDKQWGLNTYATLTWAASTVGGVGGYFFGEFAQPDPRSMGFIASGAGWGAIMGTFFGAGATGHCGADSPYCIWDGASVGGLVMTNVGILGTGIASIAGYVPSAQTLKWQWVGFGAGMLVTTPIYIVYAFSDSDPKHGLIANAIGGLAGLTLATVLTYDKKDDSAQKSGWTPPFQLSLAPTKGGLTVGAMGMW